MIARDDALAAFDADTFDLVVVGGGITGAGVALDAASRGYSVALVERDDYAAGTSSRSSKLVHGGLRYLQNFDLGLVREALLERQLMVALAPHLVRPLPLVVPAFEGQRPDRMVGMGLNLYDVMSVERLRGRRPRRFRRTPDEPAEWSPERHRIISGSEVVELVPALEQRLAHEAEVEVLQVAQAAVDELRRAARRCDARLQRRSVERDPGARDPAADDNDVEALGGERLERFRAGDHGPTARRARR